MGAVSKKQKEKAQCLRTRIRKPQGHEETEPYRLHHPPTRGQGLESGRNRPCLPHNDGKGFDILCDVVPLNGRITIRVQEQK